VASSRRESRDRTRVVGGGGDSDRGYATYVLVEAIALLAVFLSYHTVHEYVRTFTAVTVTVLLRTTCWSESDEVESCSRWSP
jgi:hypothetical protein